MMNLISPIRFAHNGIDHANGMEAAAHQSNTLLWVLAATAVTVALLYSLRKFVNRQADEIEEEEE